jgi:hypothetical protein
LEIGVDVLVEIPVTGTPFDFVGSPWGAANGFTVKS